jgi:muramidase (phage lysozyme)
MANFFDQFDGSPEPTTRITVTPVQRAFLNSMSAGESPDYNTMYGGARFEELTEHPRQKVPIRSGPNAGKSSSAAGKYQFLAGTWDEAKNALGLPDFSPDSQDAAATWLAERDYKKRTGRNLWDDLEASKDNPAKLNSVGGALSGTWTSLPGGIEPNRASSGFGQRFATDISSQSRVPQAKAGNFFDQFDAAPQSPVQSRFGQMQPPGAGGQALQSGLERRSLDMTRGPARSPAAQMAGDMANLVPTASQGTTPHIDRYGGQLVSTEAFEDDAGNVLYRDPQTGEVKPTNKDTQVAIRDPSDGVVKVFNRTEATNEGPLTGISRVLAPGLAAGAVTARPALTTAAEKIVPKASDVFSTAKPHYREFTRQASKIEVPAETASGMGNQLRRGLDKIGLDVDMAGAPARSAIGKLENPTEPMTLDYLQRVKRVAGRGFNSPDKDVRDGAAVITGEISKIISQVSPKAGESLKTADDIHSTARSMRDLQRKSDVAGLRAGRAGYGGNAVNSMRQVLSPIVQRAIEGKTTGFKPNEIAAMREIVEGTGTTNTLRAVGQLSPSKGIIQTVGAGGAMYAAGPAALAIPAIGAVSNKLATILTGKQIERLTELTAKRSPAYAQAVAKAAERFERAQEALLAAPSPKHFAEYVAGSRALSAGLQRDGIQITSGELLKSIQGPMKGAAEGEEPAVPRHPRE